MLIKLKNIIPKLIGSNGKENTGKFAVIGGCTEYTGPPFYCAISQMYGGSDIGHLVCTKNAEEPIRSYSPEIIVYPILCSLEDTNLNDFPI